MKSYHFEAVVFNYDVYCIDCLPSGVTVDNDDVTPIFASDEWDYYPACCVCGQVHDYINIIAYE